MTTTATTTWRNLLVDLVERGVRREQESAGAAFAGRTNYEVRGCTTRWPIARSLVLDPTRCSPGFRRFAPAEGAWILSGDNRVATIAPFAPSIATLSDDGLFFAGAYGPSFIANLPGLVRVLADPDSRQAVAHVLAASPGAWRDVPCTTTFQLMLRDGVLHAHVTMRSSDAWRGVPNDVHAFSMMAAYVGLWLRERVKIDHGARYEYPAVPRHLIDWAADPRLGELTLAVGSQHLYELDRERALVCAAADGELVDVAPLDLRQFDRPADLVDHLRWLANYDGRYDAVPTFGQCRKTGTYLEEVLT